ncbi:hypothetical protein BDP27DRAFT_1329542 [Rhodocollybia butyracea]|uniref:Uncharacterized protein n=1 Tax=Rhodocollybia butyracea TaxID=206335 RepID=A0A9P5PS45_9AGAR|nr:hypothetical protein BDP27DRAFT_1329542 [Rhodocollybia butyracea]
MLTGVHPVLYPLAHPLPYHQAHQAPASPIDAPMLLYHPVLYRGNDQRTLLLHCRLYLSVGKEIHSCGHYPT